MMSGAALRAPERRGAGEVFRVALRLGLTSFGGPVAHLGYFERAYVRERRWLSTDEYAGLVALCQMLPGPGSSQLSLLVGLRRAGWVGALAAWAGFTLPSALSLFAFALVAPAMRGRVLDSVLHGLQLVAVAIVAQAVWNMAPRLCPDRRRAAIALAAGALLLVIGNAEAQSLALAIGAAGGMLLCRSLPMMAPPPLAAPVGFRAGGTALAMFLALLVALPVAGRTAPHSLLAFCSVFYRSGALVFGGGHVMLPLLRDALVPNGWLSDDMFLAGYGAAQAIPGPLFTFSAYLGAIAAPPGSAALWSATALVFMFLPGVLLALAGLPIWTWLARHPAANAALAGVNAAVVGMLGATLYDPIWTSSIRQGRDAAIALVGFLLLQRWRAPPLAVVGLCVAATLLLALAV